ncbi:RHS repeat domain-containing protein [Marinobacter sp. R17]|uniref:RHS repeat domain-containing protein n=1 Tax=Marinobacter sp. R17 TaxID=2484250 RepID=UPI0016814875|nr:RHS repeat-associated core domain-containing protein [Marinobacter sp. R17]
MKRFIANTLAALAVMLIAVSRLNAAEVVTYYHNNYLGSPIAATDSSGAVIWQQAYDPWGLKLTTNTDERGYTGNWLDEETGLADHKARWFTSAIGRFTAIDPVKWHESDIQSFNRYAYAGNNPYSNTDRDGRMLRQIPPKTPNNEGPEMGGTPGRGQLIEGSIVAVSQVQSSASFLPIQLYRPPGITPSAGTIKSLSEKFGFSGSRIEAKWGVNWYKRGGAMHALDHIMMRHGPSTASAGVSKFSSGTTRSQVKRYVDQALRYGKATAKEGGGYSVKHNFGKAIGTNREGASTSRLEVKVREGRVQTAYPY